MSESSNASEQRILTPPPDYRGRVEFAWGAGFKFKRKTVFTVLLVAFALGASAAIFFGKRSIAQTAPRLSLPARPLDIGQAKPGKIVDGLFTIGNTGSSPLKFKLTPSCGCSELNPREGVLGPRESREVHIGIRLNGYGASRRVTVMVETNDPNNPEASYQVYASCPELLHIEPERVDFGVVPKGKGRVVEVNVAATKLTSKKDLEELGIETDLDLVKVSKSFDKDRLKLTFTLDDDAPLGLLSGRTKLIVPRLLETVEMPVSGDVSGPIRAAPSNLRFVRATNKMMKLDPTVLVVWRPGGEELGALLDVDAPKGISVERFGAVKDARCAVFRVQGSCATFGIGKQAIRLRFQNVSEAAVVHLALNDNP